MNYKTTYFYTLMELIRNPSTWNETYQNNVETGYYTPLQVTQALLTWEIGQELQDILASPEVETLWKDYFLGKNLHEDCLSFAEDIDTLHASSDTMNQLFGNWWRLFLTILKETYPRYKTLINIYKEKEQFLLDDIKNSSLVKFNDTPQTIEDFKDNKYVSHLTGTESSTTGGTPAERLEQVHKMWHNLYIEWCESFDQLFIEVM